MNNLNNNQVQPLICEHVIDYNTKDNAGFKISNDSNYIAIFTNSVQDIETFQTRIYHLQSFQLIKTFNISGSNLQINSIFFSDDSSYFYYFSQYSHVDHLILLNMQDLTFKTILINIQLIDYKVWFLDQILFIKDNLQLHIYNIQSEQKIEQLRFGFTFSYFVPFSSNQYYLLNDSQQTLELWFNYHNYLKNKVSTQFQMIPNRIILLKNHLILCVFNLRTIKLLSQNNFHIVRSILFMNYFINEQLYFEDKIAIVRMQDYPPKIKINNLIPQISQKQLFLQKDFLKQFDSYQLISKLFIGIKFKSQDGLELKIYKFHFDYNVENEQI